MSKKLHKDTKSSPRDKTIDYIKGFALVLMGVAHGPSWNESTLVTSIMFIGGLAPAIYFSASGYTVMAKQKLPIIFILLFILTFIFGFTYNGMNASWISDQSTGGLQIIQLIALGVFALYIFNHYRISTRTKAIFALLLPLLYYVVTPILLNIPDFTGRQYLFQSGFTLIPWLGLFFAGNAINLLNNKGRFIFIGVAISLLILTSFLSDITEKGSVSYYYLCIAFFYLCYQIFSFTAARFPSSTILMSFDRIARLSLTFLFVQIIISLYFFWPAYNLLLSILNLPWHYRASSYILLFLSITVSLLSCVMLEKINKYTFAKVGSRVLVPLCISLTLLGIISKSPLFLYIFPILGTVISLNYRSLDEYAKYLGNRIHYILTKTI